MRRIALLGFGCAEVVVCGMGGCSKHVPSETAVVEVEVACVASDTLTFDGNRTDLTVEEERYQIQFYEEDIVRVRKAGPSGNFTDPTDGLIVVAEPNSDLQTECLDKEGYYALRSGSTVVRVYKNPVRFGLYRGDDATLLFEESDPLAEEAKGMTQVWPRGEDEYFYGGGMQNGRFSHRGETLKIAVDPDYHWDDGGYPNPAPFFMSTNGYGVLRNTFAPGEYAFKKNVKLSHDEKRFDAFYFVGDGLKDILERYTHTTGRPFLAPIWGFEFGDADCYNKDGQTTADVVAIAQAYRDQDLPGGWILPNDGYGCGYTDLPEVVTALDDLGFHTGLWTEDGLDQIEWEVGTAGSRASKLDIAWVYQGYDFALNAAKTASEGLEDFGGMRRFVWTTMGWAGTHRYAVMWTGDNSGSWEYERFQIPTLIGSGLSAQNYATGDVDGIFGGSPETYVRDLQWKVFTPALMTISGWADEDRQPWRHGEPYTSHNRDALKLKMRLTPYLYSYAYEAHQTGVPVVRAMVLEYPDDPVTWGTDTQYQFMSGEWFLVAPVYRNTEERDDIYLPEGTWFDYWDGSEHTGPTTLNDYPAPLDRVPVFVKAGAIIPMWPEMLHYRDKPKDVITVDVYPDGETEFVLYEDDGVSLAHRDGAFATQRIASEVTDTGVQLTFEAVQGTFEGQLAERAWRVQMHHRSAPTAVLVDTEPSQARSSLDALEAEGTGWYYDATDRGGVLTVRVTARNASNAFSVTVDVP